MTSFEELVQQAMHGIGGHSVAHLSATKRAVEVSTAGSATGD